MPSRIKPGRKKRRLVDEEDDDLEESQSQNMASQELFSEEDEDEYDTPNRPSTSQAASSISSTAPGNFRINIPPSMIQWAKHGFYEVPAIVNVPQKKAESDDVEAAMLVKLILMLHQNREMFTRLQLSKRFAKFFSSSKFEEAFSEARRLLMVDFDFALAEIRNEIPLFRSNNADENLPAQSQDNDDEGTATQKRKPAGTGYILVSVAPKEHNVFNCVRRESGDCDSYGDDLENAKLSALTLILLYIYMEGDWVTEDFLITFLRGFGFDWDANHPLLGSIKTLLSTFCKEQYVVREKYFISSRVGAPEANRYRWGSRADLEFSRLGMLEMCAKVFGAKADIDSFGERYSNAVQLERRRQAKIDALKQEAITQD